MLLGANEHKRTKIFAHGKLSDIGLEPATEASASASTRVLKHPSQA